MNKQPLLRFKEFSDDYKEYKIQDFASRVIMGATPSTKNIEYWNSKDHPFITIPDLNFSYINKVSRFVSNKGLNKRQSVILPKGSVMYSCVATIGKTGITTEESITNRQIYSIVPNEKIASEYLLMLLNANYNYIYNLIPQSSTMKIITLDGFKNINFYIPSLFEQQKVATFFQSFDNLITNLKKQNSILKKYFLPYMLPVNNNPIPIIRFKEFNDDYKEYKIGGKEINLKIYAGCPELSKKHFLENVSDYSVITHGQIIKQEIIHKGIKYIDDKNFHKLKNRTMANNSILMSFAGTIGKIAVFKQIDKFAVILQQGILFKYNDNFIEHNYFLILLKRKKFFNDMNQKAAGSTQKNLNLNKMIGYKFLIPSLLEQQKVANLLGKIQKNNELITKIDNIKKQFLPLFFI